MKKIILIFIGYGSFCVASERPVHQTHYLPSVTRDLLAVQAQFSPQTQPHHETHDQEIERLRATNKNLQEMLNKQSSELNTVILQKDSSISVLEASVRNLTKVSQIQGNKLLETKKQLLHAENELEIMAATLESLTQEHARYQARIEEKVQQLRVAQQVTLSQLSK